MKGSKDNILSREAYLSQQSTENMQMTFKSNLEEKRFRLAEFPEVEEAMLFTSDLKQKMQRLFR